MLLCIDTSDRERIVIKLGDKTIKVESVNTKSQKLLPTIVDSLAGIGKSLADIGEIRVNTGPGSFTGLRVGVAVANTLGWVLNVPVNGCRVKEGLVDIKYL